MKRKYSNKFLLNKGKEKKVKVLAAGKGKKLLSAAIMSAVLVSGIADYGNTKEKEDVK